MPGDRIEIGTREAILEAARHILVSAGYEALTMRRVAKAVGVSATALYRHFDDKDALLSAAVTHGARIFGSYLLDALTEPTPWARLRRMGERYFDFAQQHRHDYHLLFMLDCQQSGMQKLDENAQSETRSTFMLLVDRIAECQKAGEVIAFDPAALAVYVWSSYHGLASLHIVGRIDEDETAHARLVSAQIELTLSSLRTNHHRHHDIT